MEKVVPSRSLHVRDLSPGSVRINATASISVEEATDRETTWIEEAIFYSLGKSGAMQWLDRSLVNPVLQLVAGYNILNQRMVNKYRLSHLTDWRA